MENQRDGFAMAKPSNQPRARDGRPNRGPGMGRPHGGANRPTGTDHDRMPEADRTELARRLNARKEELGLTHAQIAKRGSISVDAVRKILGAKQPNPEYVVLRALHRALDYPLALILDVATAVRAEEATAIPVIGQAEVGVYRSQKPQPGGAIAHAPLPSDPRFATNERIAVPLMDDELEGLTPPAPRGHHALVIVLRAGEVEIEHGRIYLIHRPNSDGAIETAFRRAAVYPDRYEFTPVSPDPERNERQKLKVERGHFHDSDITIGGLFYATSCQYL